MKLNENEKRLLVSALSYAIAEQDRTFNTAKSWHYRGLREKLETALRTGEK